MGLTWLPAAWGENGSRDGGNPDQAVRPGAEQNPIPPPASDERVF